MMIPFQSVLWIFCLVTMVTALSVGDFGERSHHLLGSEFVTEKVKNFLQCKSLCDRRSLCKSVNYNARSRSCALNYHDVTTSDTSPSPAASWVVFMEKRFMQTGGGACDRNQCGENQVCTQLKGAGPLTDTCSQVI
ncbi:uncharacterized protein LOC121373060 [Gigantopelta aegis]|uniref:uncharacterized protein LOC121373060 n=1 Tax=Gigantopelta aegis TaxID=1735272 RepID=UPI001B8894F0|nr:uncharacterized protein LOC121373060 [Gigantopelta aegis]